MPPDESLRRVVFWVVLLGTAGAIAAAHVVEGYLSYDVVAAGHMRHGSSGAALARYSKATAPVKTVAILGNSVQQRLAIDPYMKDFAEREGRPIRFINLALTGAGISDYVIQAAEVTRQKPDLVVVFLAECTFLPLGPKFRSDADQQAFDPAVLATVPWSFYPRHFGLASAGASIVSSIFPLPRLDPILRHELAHEQAFPKILTRHLHFPNLNLVADYRARARGRARQAIGGAWPTLPPVEDYRQTMVELMEVLEQSGVPTLVIWQENRPTRYSDEIRTTITNVISRYDIATVADFGLQWNEEHFADTIHPTPEHLEAYANRHYAVICTVLDSL